MKNFALVFSLLFFLCFPAALKLPLRKTPKPRANPGWNEQKKFQAMNGFTGKQLRFYFSGSNWFNLKQVTGDIAVKGGSNRLNFGSRNL